jgi:hypothetical protein
MPPDSNACCRASTGTPIHGDRTGDRRGILSGVRFEVDPGALTGGAAEGSLVQDDVVGTRGLIDAAGSGASAVGQPAAAGAVGEACTAWSGALGALGDAIGQLHLNLGAAARAYAVTDASVIDP